MTDTLVEKGGRERGRMDDAQDKGERGDLSEVPVHAGAGDNCNEIGLCSSIDYSAAARGLLRTHLTDYY